LILANNAAGGVLGFVILFAIANYLYDADYTYGVVAFGLGLLGMYAFILNPGTDTAHIKRISEGMDEGECVGTYLAIKFVLTAVFIIVVLSSLFGWKHLLGKGFESPQHEVAIYILLVNFILTSFNGVFVATYEAKKEVAKVQIGMLLSTISRLAAVLIVLYFQLGIFGLAVTWNISMLSYFLASLILFRGVKIGRPRWVLAKNYMKFALPLVFVTMAAKLAMTTDRVMIQFFWGSADVGHYFAAMRFTAFLTFFGMAARKLVFPTISELYSKNKKHYIQDLTWSAEKYIALLLTPICFFIIFFPRDIILIMMSEKFLPAAAILAVFSVHGLITALNVPYAIQFAGANRPKMAAAIGVPKAILNIIFNMLLIPPAIFGITLLGLKGLGAAIGTLASSVLYTIFVRIVIYKKVTGVKSNWRLVFNLIAASVMVLFLRFVLYDIYPIERIYDFLIYAAIGAPIYFAAMMALGQLPMKDIRYIMKVVNPVEMIRYIRNEIFGKK